MKAILYDRQYQTLNGCILGVHNSKIIYFPDEEIGFCEQKNGKFSSFTKDSELCNEALEVEKSIKNSAKDLEYNGANIENIKEIYTNDKNIEEMVRREKIFSALQKKENSRIEHIFSRVISAHNSGH